jgi:outer membrane protein assembly factor BamA
MPVLQTFRAQVFTNDQKNAGLTLQQTLRLGTRYPAETQDPYLKSTTIVAPEGVRKRRIRGAIDFRKSDPFPKGAGLDVEVDVIDHMRKRGFPEAQVGVDVEDVGKNHVAVVVSVEPGTPVQFVFEGDPLPSRTRKSIATSYRPLELGERNALQEIQRETVSALREQGYLEPRADVEAVPAGMTDAAAPAVVRVTADGGRRIDLVAVDLRGLPEAEAERLASLFGSTLSKMELAIESPIADAMLLRALDARGYPGARIVGRELSELGDALVVQIEPGSRRRVASVEIVGLDEEDRDRLLETLEVHEGDPAEADRIGFAQRAIERDLRRRGHAEARVRARVRPVAEDQPFDVALRYEVDPGASYRIEEVRFEGLRASRRRWVEKVAGLEAGEPFRRKDLADARARLFRTGVFRRIHTSFSDEPGADLEPVADDGDLEAASLSPSTADTKVTFKLEESRRWQLAYGGRWEEGTGVSAVVDLVNRNSFGIGHLTGARAIYGSELRDLRLYHVIPRVVGQRSSLELLIEGKRERISSNLDLVTAEAWAQLTFPLSARTHNRPYIRFQKPRFDEKTPDPNTQPDERVISPLLGWQIAFDSTSRRIGEERRRGIFFGVDFLGSLEEWGSDVTLFGVVSQFKYFLPLGEPASGRFTWAQFWRGGWNEAKGQDVPFVDRFRLGGEYSVRGYPTNSLGPVGADGIPLGGELLFIVNQEIHAQLLRTERAGSVSALAFFDAGNVWENRDSFTTDLFKSVGIGARYLSPIGPLRLDFAVPLDRRLDDPEYKIYLGFGSVF